MPKMKTRKTFSKRVKVTKKKKTLRAHAGRRHLLSGKSAKRKRKLRNKAVVSSAKSLILRKAMPYS